MSKKLGMAKLSVGSNTFLIIIKFIVGFLSNSVSIISEAIHSTMDLAASIIAYISIRLSARPPDKGHPYGHDKIENVSGVAEALLIIMASAYIVFEAVKKLINHQHVQNVGWGFAVMMISAVVNTIVSAKLYKVARAEESVALEADALHLKADVYTSLGVAGGLLILWITDLHFLDPLVAIFIALMILKEAFDMLKSAYQPLIDTQLSEEEIEKIKIVIDRYSDTFVDIHELRTRRSGKIKHIDLHLTAPEKMTIKEYHEVCDRIEKEIDALLKNTDVLIHVEPCLKECPKCSLKTSGNKYCS